MADVISFFSRKRSKSNNIEVEISKNDSDIKRRRILMESVFDKNDAPPKRKRSSDSIICMIGDEKFELPRSCPDRQPDAKKSRVTHSQPRSKYASSMKLFRRPKVLGMKMFFLTWKEKERKERTKKRKQQYIIEKWRAHVAGSCKVILTDGLEKFNSLIHALNRLDDLGYRRSKQQIEFHTTFLGSMVQQIFGSDLNKYLNEILQKLGLKELNKDVAVCCPRRFGKTTSVAAYSAATIYTQGDMDFVIYSIAMRTSRMLTARIYQMVIALAGGTHVIQTSNQEILTISSIAGGSSTVYSYPAASAISITQCFIYTHTHTHIYIVYFEASKYKA